MITIRAASISLLSPICSPWLFIFLKVTFDDGVDGAVKPFLGHTSWHLLPVEMIRNGCKTFPRIPQLHDLEDDFVFMWIHDKFALQPRITVRQDRRTH